MEEPFDEPLTELSQIDSLQNLDIARMSLRWALERIHSLEVRVADLTENLHEAAPTTEAEHKRLAASMEEYVLLPLAGKLDLTPLLARELKALRLRTDLESGKARMEAEHAARRRELEEKFSRLKAELQSASSAHSRQLEEETRRRQDALEADLAERAHALQRAEEDLQRRERELERDHEARRLREEQELARRADSALTAWDQERASLRLENKNLETLCAQQTADMRRAEEALARENERRQAIETQTAAVEQEREQAQQNIIVLLEKEKIDLATRLASAESNALELKDKICGLEREKDEIRQEGQRSLAERQKEFAQNEENLRGQLEWLEQCLEEAKAQPPPPDPPVQADSLSLLERFRRVESTAEKSSELLERERVWREDMTHTWDLLLSQAKSVWLGDKEKENLVKEFNISLLAIKTELANAQTELANAQEELRITRENHRADLNRLHELETIHKTLVEREGQALFDNAKLRGDTVAWASKGKSFEDKAASLEASLHQVRDQLRQTEENLQSEIGAHLKTKGQLQAASASLAESASRVKTLEEELRTLIDARRKAEECLKATLAATEQAALENAKLLTRETQKREALDAELRNTQASLEALTQRTKRAFSEDQLETQMLTHEIAALKSKLTEAEQSAREAAKMLQLETLKREALDAELHKTHAALEAQARKTENASHENLQEAQRLASENEMLQSQLSQSARAAETSAQKSRVLEESLATLMEERDRLRVEARMPAEPAPETARVKELESSLALEIQRRKKLEDFIAAQKGGGPDGDHQAGPGVPSR